jgi:YesN/AraC family two-component response regulator
MRIYRQSTFFVEKKGMLIKKYKTNLPSHPHTHDFIEIVFVTNGEGIHTIDGVDYPIVAGSFFVVDNEKTHSILPMSMAEYYNIFLTVDFVKKMKLYDANGNQSNVYNYLKTSEDNPVAIYLNSETASELERYFEAMYLEFSSKKQLYNEAMRAYMKLIMTACIRFRQKAFNAPDVKSPQNMLPRIIDYINKYYSEKITLQSIAEKYGYNSAYFGRLFKKNYGISFNQYLYRKRIDAACELLITTNQNISEVASNVGFTNTTHFYKEFENIVNCTPKEYRARELNRDNIFATRK